MCRRLSKDQKEKILDKVIETAEELEHRLDDLVNHVKSDGTCQPKPIKK